MSFKQGWSLNTADNTNTSAPYPQPSSETQHNLPYTLAPSAPPSYSPQLPYQHPLPSNYPDIPSPVFIPPSSPPPPYNLTYACNAYPPQPPFFPQYIPAQSPIFQQPQQPYPFQPHPYPSHGPEPFLNNGNATTPTSGGSMPVSPEDRPDQRNVSRVSGIGFQENGNNHHTIYPNLPNEISTSNSNQQIHQKYVPTPLPPNLVLLWESSVPINIYFVQEEDFVVSPVSQLKLSAHKCPPMNDVSSFPIGCLAGNARNASVLMKAEDTWRLGLQKERSYIVRGIYGEFAFYDDSTSPARIAVIVFTRGIDKAERQRFDVLVQASSNISDEPANMVDNFESGVGSVFNTLTQSVNNAVKKQTPDIHKSTKWLRKGTGQVVRFGGNLVSKGVHLVSDNVMEKEAPKEATPQHQEIYKALIRYRTALDENKVTKITEIK